MVNTKSLLNPVKQQNEVIKKQKSNNNKIMQDSTAWGQLNDKQRVFVLEYLRSFNATAAYRAAYPEAKSIAGAAASASKMLRNAKINEAIKEQLHEFWDNKQKECGRALSEIVTLAYSNISDVITISKGQLTIKNLSQIDSRVIKSIKQTNSLNGDSIQVTLYDKVQALSLLLKILNMFPNEKVEHSGTIEIIPAQRPDREGK